MVKAGKAGSGQTGPTNSPQLERPYLVTAALFFSGFDKLSLSGGVYYPFVLRRC